VPLTLGGGKIQLGWRQRWGHMEEEGEGQRCASSLSPSKEEEDDVDGP
jgi:hypothetical protein